MALIPTSLARRIDRAARHAHRFHRFAHHPLCKAYAGELVRLGPRARVCRGCSMTAVGLMMGVALGASFGPGTWVAPVAWLVASLFALAGSLRTPWPPAAAGVPVPRRISKIVSRFLPALWLGAAIGQAFRAGLVATMLVGGTAGVGVGVFAALYRRRGPDRTPCTVCPERLLNPCSGFLPIVRRERAFRRLSGVMLHRNF
jgi:hypothetical protein